MKEYIERERLKEAFHADLQSLQSVDEHTMNLILIEIDEAPAADVASVRHGRWIDSSNGWMCSVCERDSTYDTLYCPHCGALMDGKENNI